MQSEAAKPTVLADGSLYVPDDYIVMSETDEKTIERLTTQLAITREALEMVFVGGDHLALLIGADHPTYSTDPEEALEWYGQDNLDMHNAWCCWRSIMLARQALTQMDATND